MRVSRLELAVVYQSALEWVSERSENRVKKNGSEIFRETGRMKIT